VNGERSVTDLVVLTGFLGSGKTTLLVDFLKQPESDNTAVIVNEVGEINIDGAVIAETGKALPVALLSNGCVCCSVANDLLYTIEALLESRRAGDTGPFRRIVLECSGLARPASLLRSLGALAIHGMPIRVVATLDAREPPVDLGFEDAVAQLAAAQFIVLTKLDQASPTQRRTAEEFARAANPFASIVGTEDRHQRALCAFAFGQETARRVADTPEAAPGPLGHPRIQVARATFPEPLAWEEFEEWLENLCCLCGARLLRVKGIVRIAGVSEPLLVQSVGNLVGQPRRLLGAQPIRDGVVIIVRDLSLDDLCGASLGPTAGFSLGTPY
jgi:G3E family GTPase